VATIAVTAALVAELAAPVRLSYRPIAGVTGVGVLTVRAQYAVRAVRQSTLAAYGAAVTAALAAPPRRVAALPSVGDRDAEASGSRGGAAAGGAGAGSSSSVVASKRSGGGGGSSGGSVAVRGR